ncbi:cytochrome P450 [Streptomyces kutzneri]|uniref:cytochrome P450 n=1 Tax=Streptomyces kutzneri TaxID=3051179 RepID=UPI0028D3B169|nr:cytochrome P450 [Streptomyces sp. DSM 40907]
MTSRTDTGLPVPLVPGRLPLLGHAPHLARRPLSFLRSLPQYGELVRIRIGPQDVYVATSAALTRQILVPDSRKFDKGEMFDELRQQMGNGLVTSSGDFHRSQRRLVQPAFHPTRVTSYAQVMSDRAAAWAATWQPDTVLDLARQIDTVTLGTLLDVVFDDTSDDLRTAVRTWAAVRNGAMRRALSPAAAWRSRLAGAHQPGTDPEADRAVTALRGVIGQEIDQRRTGDQDPGGLLSTLVHARDCQSGAGMSDQEICDEILNLFVAGTGTMSATLAWAFHETARHPDVEAQLLAEIEAVAGRSQVQGEHIPHLPYTRQVLSEVLRRHPTWLLMRRSTQPLTLGDAHLPAGARVYLSPHILHHDPALFPDPDSFDPDRWLPDRITPQHTNVFIPFSAGNRRCAGDHYAWTQLTLMLTNALARWRLRPADDRPVNSRVGTVERPDRLMMVPSPR